MYTRIFLLALTLAYPISAQLLIAAAADLAPLEKPLTSAFQQETGIGVRFSFGSSGMLARQVDNGAPFDVYLSANQQFVQELDKSGRLISGTVCSYATGRLGLWSKSGRVRHLEQLAGLRHVAVANPRHAPYGMAARELMQRHGMWAKLQVQLVLAENVRQAFEYANTGNADAVITSWTLLYDRGGILLPDTDHAPISQSGAVVKGSKNEAAARRFLQFLTGPAGQRILIDGGLFPPR